MLEITETEIKKRLSFDNPWWEEGSVPKKFREWTRRAYFEGFLKPVQQSAINRAVVLMGPRRVGKTVMLTQAIQSLIDAGVAPNQIFYISVDTPTYTGLSLEKLLRLFMEIHGHSRNDKLYVIFDEVQYHPDWERHLKSLVDSFPSMRFVASGSAAAALKMKSRESGAGRFTDYLLPPLTFLEFLRFTGVITGELKPGDQLPKIEALNDAFVDYINFGGFPETVLNPEVRDGMDRFVAEDIVDKVLLRDIPSLYGIQNSQELKRFFTVLAYNTGSEVSFESLSQTSGVAKNTIRKYLDYLEAAYLIFRLYRVDQNARRFKRVTHFKVYLTNPCIRAALFGPIDADNSAMGALAETAIIAQLAPTLIASLIYYARWQAGEVDFVYLTALDQQPLSVKEIKWSDRVVNHLSEELSALLSFCRQNGLSKATVSTKSVSSDLNYRGIKIQFMPVSLICLAYAAFGIDERLRDGIDPRTGYPIGEGPHQLFESLFRQPEP